MLRGTRHPRGDVHPGLRGDPPRAPGARPRRRGRAPRRARSTSTPRCRRSSPAGCTTDARRRPGRHRRPRDRGLHRQRCAGQRRRLAPVYSLIIATEPLPPDVWDEIGLAPARDVLRPPAPDHLRAAHRRRPAGLRRPRGAVPLRLADPAGLRPRRAGLRQALRATLVDLFPVLAGTRVTHAWGGALGIPRDWCASVGLDRGDRARLGRRVRRRRGQHDQPRRPDPARPGPRPRHRADPTAVGRPPLPAWEPEPLRWLGINTGLRAMTWPTPRSG